MQKSNKVVIIGAGPSGIGMAIALIEMGLDDILILDKGQVGESFKNWPLSTRFITPSFTTNGFGTPDINAITPHSSPAFTFKKEHISGKEYVQYLEALVQIYNLKIDQHTNVLDVSNNIDKDTYKIYTDQGTIDAEYIFVATGNFSYPYKPFNHGRHYSEIEKFSDIYGDLAVVIGGNESGFDAAINLALSGKIVDIYTNSTSYKQEDADPSIRL
ncbi:NAD(P)-binding domain-containing protein, partial [Staphylococcus sp. HMSC062C03]